MDDEPITGDLRIAYLVTDSGVDGREPTKVLYATFDPHLRRALLNNDASKAHRSTSETIIDVKKARANALAKLDGIDRLVLNLRPWPSNDGR